MTSRCYSLRTYQCLLDNIAVLAISSLPPATQTHPEVELLLCCAQTYIDTARAERVRTLVQEAIDWPALLRMALQHRVVPLVYNSLRTTCPDAVPQGILEQLRDHVSANAERSLFLLRQLLTLLRLLEEHGIPTIPFKGPLLAATAYGNLTLRQFSDLDILVHKWDYHFRVNELLTSHGWRLCSDYGWERGFVDSSGRIILDVHEGITHRDMPFRLGFNRVWKRCVTVSIAGTSVRTFAPSDLLIILCVQLAKDVAVHKIQLNKICDITELVRSQQDMDWKWVLRKARSLGALGMLHIGLRSAAELLGIAVPKDVLQKSQTGQSLNALVTHVRECVLDSTEREYSRPELLHASRFHAEVRERIRDRVDPKYVYLITPNTYDYAFVRLPRAWFSLYYVLRPIRLIYQYGRRKLW